MSARPNPTGLKTPLQNKKQLILATRQQAKQTTQGILSSPIDQSKIGVISMDDIEPTNNRASAAANGTHGKETESDNKIIARHIISVADLSFQTEINRDGSLKSFAEQLLTCITILSVAYLTTAQLIIDAGKRYGKCWQRAVSFAYLALLIPLLTALVLALASLAFRKAKLLSSPIEQFDYFSKMLDKGRADGFEVGHLDIAKSYCDALENEYEALKQKHARMTLLLKVAAVLVIFSVVIAAIGIIAFSISTLWLGG